jgi:hypothetical protein
MNFPSVGTRRLCPPPNLYAECGRILVHRNTPIARLNNTAFLQAAEAIDVGPSAAVEKWDEPRIA